MDKEKKSFKDAVAASKPEPAGTSHIDEFFRSLQPEMRTTAGADPRAVAMEAIQHGAAEIEEEQSTDDLAQELAGDSAAGVCQICGHRNRVGNRFCAMCGVPVGEESGERALTEEEKRPLPPVAAVPPVPLADEPGARPRTSQPAGLETHHYHHHYHHHYFPAGYDGASPRPAADFGREEKRRPNAALRGEMSRAEAEVRRITHEWVLACNTKHLDDLLDLYIADALVLRSNYPPVRGVAAVREFFFGALEAGLGDVEVNLCGWKSQGIWPTRPGAARLWCRVQAAKGAKNAASICGFLRVRLTASGSSRWTAGRAIFRSLCSSRTFRWVWL